MSLPTLDPVELRVLGALVEKELATPDHYPLTLNALVAACNQKTARDPVLALDGREVKAALERLQRRRLVGTASGAGHRVAKFRHALSEALRLSRREMAALAVLILRGPQTPGELRSRVGRMATLESVDAADEVLWMLGDRDEPLVVSLGRGPGQSADRYAHRLGGELGPGLAPGPDAGPDAAAAAGSRSDGRSSDGGSPDREPASPAPGGLAARVAALEATVAALRSDLDALRGALGG